MTACKQVRLGACAVDAWARFWPTQSYFARSRSSSPLPLPPPCMKILMDFWADMRALMKKKLGSQGPSTVIILYFEICKVASMVSPGGVVVITPD